jgi:hypothetical protein
MTGRGQNLPYCHVLPWKRREEKRREEKRREVFSSLLSVPCAVAFISALQLCLA